MCWKSTRLFISALALFVLLQQATEGWALSRAAHRPSVPFRSGRTAQLAFGVPSKSSRSNRFSYLEDDRFGELEPERGAPHKRVQSSFGEELVRDENVGESAGNAVANDEAAYVEADPVRYWEELDTEMTADRSLIEMPRPIIEELEGSPCAIGSKSRLGKCNEHCACINGTWQCCRVRKDISELSDDELDLLATAFYKMRQNKTTTAMFQFLADNHVKYRMTVHSWPYFLPWHRMWLYIFEEVLRSVDCRVTVPYYDFTKHWKDWYAHSPFDKEHIGGNGAGKDCCVSTGPFRKGLWTTLPNFGGGCLQRTFNKSKLMPSPRIASLAVTLFTAEKEDLMSNLISKYFHDIPHAAVGGQMMLATAAVDPAFWMLHSFLDKMWGAWQSRGVTFKRQKLAQMHSLLLPGSPPGTTYTPVDFYDLSKQPNGHRVCYSSQMSDEEAEFESVFTGPSVPRRKSTRRFSALHIINMIKNLDGDELKQLSQMLGLATGKLQHASVPMPNDCIWTTVNGTVKARPGLPKVYHISEGLGKSGRVW